MIDRLVLRDGIRKRLADSLEIAARHGDQIIKVRIASENDADGGREMAFSQKLACLHCGASAPEITPGLFRLIVPKALVRAATAWAKSPSAANGSKIALPCRARSAAARA